MDQSAVGTGGPGADWAGAVGGMVQLGHALERGEGSAPVRDATHADSKALRKERQKKIAQGHAEDDHEEEQTWQQTM